jgi:hypothetical protein
LSVLPDPWQAEQQQQQQQQQQEAEHADAALTGQLQDAVLCSVLGVGLELLRDGSQQVSTQGVRVGARAESCWYAAMCSNNQAVNWRA